MMVKDGELEERWISMRKRVVEGSELVELAAGLDGTEHGV